MSEQSLGPYRLEMIEDEERFETALRSFLRLYDFDLDWWGEYTDRRLEIHAHERKGARD